MSIANQLRLAPRSEPRPRVDSGGRVHLRLLSYNIQSGVRVGQFREYLTKSWQQVLPYPGRQANLARIAEMLLPHDLVGLQEVDAGSLRTGFVDQLEYLAYKARFPYSHSQINRPIGKLAKQSNGVLSRLAPSRCLEHKLPGLSGRGAILMEFATRGAETLAVGVMHLALGRRARQRQLAFVAELVSQYPHLILMGDFNCNCESQELRDLMEATDLRGPTCEMKTFPSWRPMRNLDHILVSPALEILNARVLDYPMSDHLPVSMEIRLPERVAILG
jgi:endonuclease/exonuclease/phosphatase family metal-dependent hydrolase